MRTEESTSLCDIKFKIVFLGDMGVGKTSIIERFVKDEFQTTNNPTIGIDFLSRNITYNNNLYRLQLWDTAGQEKYKSLVPAYLRDANCAIFVIDITRRETLQHLKGWIQLFRDHQSEKAIAILVGNKTDMEEERTLKQEQIHEFSKQQGIEYREVSAKSGEGVMDLFKRILQILTHKNLQEEEYKEISDNFFRKYEKLRGTKERNDRLPCCYI